MSHLYFILLCIGKNGLVGLSKRVASSVSEYDLSIVVLSFIVHCSVVVKIPPPMTTYTYKETFLKYTFSEIKRASELTLALT